VDGDEGAKLENFVALSLLKHVYGKTDILAEGYFLHYLRTKDGQEVDFALVRGDKIIQMIEVKFSDGKASRSLKTFYEKYRYPAVQLVKTIRNEHQQGNIQILNVQKFSSQLTI
jgi:hypothetical protein